jgi:hypothetical protein
MLTYTKLAADGTELPADATGHLAVRVEHTLLAKPIIVTAQRSPERMTWEQAKKWAESLDTNGWQWRLPTVEEAFLICDRSRATLPALPPEYFPDCEGEAIWTGTVDAESPSGYAWSVFLRLGNSFWDGQSYHGHVRAVRAGQF